MGGGASSLRPSNLFSRNNTTRASETRLNNDSSGSRQDTAELQSNIDVVSNEVILLIRFVISTSFAVLSF
jgi:hypothetical protein